MRAPILAAMAALALVAPARADQILGQGRIDSSNRVIMPGGPTLGLWQNGKFTSIPDAIRLRGTITCDTGSPCDGSALPVTPQGTSTAAPLNVLMKNMPQFSNGTLSILNGPTLGKVTNGFYSPYGGVADSKNVYVAVGGNDNNDGLSPLAPKATLQAAVNTASPGGRVTLGTGSFVLSDSLFMPAGVKLLCVPGSIIVRGNNTSFQSLIDFSSAKANGGGIDGCTINDNQEANTTNNGFFTVNIGDANDVRITNNTIYNSLGYSVYARNGLRPYVVGNYIQGSFVSAITIAPTQGSQPISGTITDNVLLGPFGLHAMIVNQADNTVISRNRVTSPQPIIPYGNVFHNNIAPAVAGAFGAVKAGQFVTFGGGVELLITAKNADGSLTVNSDGGSIYNTPLVIGDGDLISVANSTHMVISDNYVTGGGAGGIVVSNFIAYPGNQQDFAFNSVVNNTVTFSGASCISIQATTTTPTTSVYDNIISGNLVHRCGIGVSAGVAGNRAGISAFDFTGGIGLARTTITNNVVRDDLNNTLYGITLNGIANGQVFASGNQLRGAANQGIQNAIKSIGLSGWGAGAYTQDVVSYGSSYKITVVAGSTNGTFGPTMSITTAATTPEFPPVMSCKMAAGTGAIAPISGEQNADDPIQTLVYQGTPTAGSTYIIHCK